MSPVVGNVGSGCPQAGRSLTLEMVRPSDRWQGARTIAGWLPGAGQVRQEVSRQVMVAAGRRTRWQVGPGREQEGWSADLAGWLTGQCAIGPEQNRDRQMCRNTGRNDLAELASTGHAIVVPNRTEPGR
jgi:hypothetical protein